MSLLQGIDIATEIPGFRDYLASQGYARATIESYTTDLKVISKNLVGGRSVIDAIDISSEIVPTRHRRASAINCLLRYLGETEGLNESAIKPSKIFGSKPWKRKPSDITLEQVVESIRKAPSVFNERQMYRKARDVLIATLVASGDISTKRIVTLQRDDFNVNGNTIIIAQDLEPVRYNRDLSPEVTTYAQRVDEHRIRTNTENPALVLNILGDSLSPRSIRRNFSHYTHGTGLPAEGILRDLRLNARATKKNSA